MRKIVASSFALLALLVGLAAPAQAASRSADNPVISSTDNGRAPSGGFEWTIPIKN